MKKAFTFLCYGIYIYSSSLFGGEIKNLIPEEYIQSLVDGYDSEEQNKIDSDLNNLRALCFEDRSPLEEGKPVYIATAGGVGTSKTTILETYLSETKDKNIVYLDPDQRALKFMINTYGQSLTNYHLSLGKPYAEVNQKAYEKWRDASNYIANTLLNEAYAGRYNIAHGTTSSSPKMADLYQKLQQVGYKIILLVCASLDENRQAAVKNRMEKQVFYQSNPKDFSEKTKMVFDNFPTYFKYADEIIFYWIDHFQHKATKVGSFSKKEGLKTHDRQGMEKFDKFYKTYSSRDLQSLVATF